MTKFKKVFFSGLAAVLLALPLAQAQQGPGPEPREHDGSHIQEIFKQLDLTDEQKQQLETAKKQHRTEAASDRRAIRDAREAMRVELMKSQLDMAKIRQIHSQIKSLQDKMEDERLNSILTVRTILTQEQFQKFSSLMHKHKPPMHE
jgi:Spy/CpxP family protein refolding chaperone